MKLYKNNLVNGFLTVLLSGFFLLPGTVDAQRNGNANGNNDKITICHLPPGNPDNVQTITIDRSAWQAHKDHGDSMGDCSGKKITICHYPPGNPANVQTISIAEEAWAAHEAHGDSRGTDCEEVEEDDTDVNDEGEEEEEEEEDDTVTTQDDETTEEESGEETTDPEEEVVDIEEEGVTGDDCSLDYSSSLEKLGSSIESDGILTTYLATVTYSGSESFSLSHLTIALPCGEVVDVSNSGGWEQVLNDTDGSTGIYGFKIDNIEGFGDGSDAQTFTVEFTHVATDLDCLDCSFDVTYKAGSCDMTETITTTCDVEIPEVPTASFTTESVEVCEGQEAALSVTLTGIGPWTLSYADGDEVIVIEGIDTDQYAIESLDPGTYSLVSVKDLFGQDGLAEGTSSVTIVEAPKAEVTGGGAICEGEEMEVTFNLSGTGPWTIEYTDGLESYTAETNQNSYTIVTGVQGEYKVTYVEDANCSNSTSSESFATVELLELPSAEISGGGNICDGEEATLNFDLGGKGPWTVVYGNGTDTYEFFSEEPTVSQIVTKGGDYEIVSVNNGQCTTGGVGTVEIIESSEIDGSIAISETYCEGEEMIIEFMPVNPGDLEVEWETTGNGTFVNKEGLLIFYRPATTDEDITFTAHLSNACNEKSESISTVITQLDASFEFTPAEREIRTNLEYTFTPSDETADSYEWTFDGEKEYGRVVYKKFEEKGDHSVSLKIEKGKCSETFEIVIPVVANRNLFVPTAFNPESPKENNSKVKVFGEGISSDNFVFQIYNRWGLLVYSTTSFEDANVNGWNGRSRGEPQENGVYTYILRGKFKDGEIFEKTGTVTLVK